MRQTRVTLGRPMRIYGIMCVLLLERLNHALSCCSVPTYAEDTTLPRTGNGIEIMSQDINYGNRDRSRPKRSGKARNHAGSLGRGNTAMGGAVVAVVAGAAYASLGFIRRLSKERDSLQKELDNTYYRLRESTSQVSELSIELEDTRQQLRNRTEDLENTVRELEARTAALLSTTADLEAARGELGLTKSRMSIIEKELFSARRSLQTFQSQLEIARCDLEGARLGETSANIWG